MRANELLCRSGVVVAPQATAQPLAVKLMISRIQLAILGWHGNIWEISFTTTTMRSKQVSSIGRVSANE